MQTNLLPHHRLLRHRGRSCPMRSLEQRVRHSVPKVCRKVSCKGEPKNFIEPFQLERFFSKYEFAVPHNLCASDCEPQLMKDLLAKADDEVLQLWDSLSLAYTETTGLPVLLEEIAKQYSTLAAEDLVVAAPEELIFLAMSTLVQPGDTVITTYPGYQSLYEVPRSRGATVKFWEPRYDAAAAQHSTDRGRLVFDVEDLRELAAGCENLALVAVNFPHNPTGAMLREAEMREVVELVCGRGAWLFSDEMYRGLEAEREEQIPSAADMHDRAIALSGLSKTYGCPGLRVGWLASCSRAVIDAVASGKDYTTICHPAPAEVLALAALRDGSTLAAAARAQIAANAAAAREAFGRLGGAVEWHEPQGGSIAFPRLRGEDADVQQWAEQMIEERGVLVLPAHMFDHAPSIQNNHFRLGLGRRGFQEGLPLLQASLEGQP
eukprot:jgi/Ulvmu1/3874/UM018_0093.1